ncbi:MAG: GumC family protein [Erythrobacter sp.]
MNDRAVIDPNSGPQGRDVWVPQYLPPSYPEPRASGIKIDTQWLRGALFRQRWVLLAATVLMLALGLAYTLLTEPTYEATASVNVEPFAASIVDGQEVSAAVYYSNEVESYLNTLLEIIKSRSLAETVVRDAKLANRRELLGPDIDAARPEGMSDAKWEEEKIAMAASVVRGMVEPELPKDSRIILISVRAQNPVLAAEVANAYATAFVARNSRQSESTLVYAREYIKQQIDTVRQRLNEAELTANAYARNAGIVTQQVASSDGQSMVTITGSNLAEVNQTFVAARARRIAAEQKWQAISNTPPSQVAEVLNSGVVQGLLAERSKLNAELIGLQQRYTDDFPALVDVRARLQIIDDQLARVGNDIKASIRSEYLIARQQEQALQSELSSVSSDALSEQDRTVELGTLEREAAALRDQLKALLDRYNQLSSAVGAENNTLSKLDSATVPAEPVAPSLKRNLLIAMLLGLGLGGGLGLLREFFIDLLRRPEDVTERLGIPLLGITPKIKSEDLDSDVADIRSLIEAYTSIRSSIDYNLPRTGSVLQLTSSKPTEGKSTTSLILAQLFAGIGRKTLLIDGDLRKPSVSRLLDIERPKLGLAEVLRGQATFDEARIDNTRENLSVLAVGPIPPDPAELLSSLRFREFLAERREEFDLVIIDCSPLLGLADSTEVAKAVDGTILVLQANSTSVSQARTSISRLRAVGANIIGGILTKYSALDAGEDYAYEYAYYQYGDDSKN